MPILFAFIHFALSLAKSPQQVVIDFLSNHLKSANYNTLLRPRKNYRQDIKVGVKIQMNSLRSLVCFVKINAFKIRKYCGMVHGLKMGVNAELE